MSWWSGCRCGVLPDLHFTLDLSQEHVERIEQLLKRSEEREAAHA